MLTTLETGVKGGTWFRLMDKVFSAENLCWSRVPVAQNKGAAGVDHVTMDDFAQRLTHNLPSLSETWRHGQYIDLDPLDHRMAEAGFEMVRYADDRRGRTVRRGTWESTTIQRTAASPRPTARGGNPVSDR